MTHVPSDATSAFPLAEVLAAHWGWSDLEIAEHPGGTNSQTWAVRCGGERWLAKAVDDARYGQQFVAGLEAAVRLEAGGIAAREPVPARNGSIAIVERGRRVALRSFHPQFAGGSPWFGSALA